MKNDRKSRECTKLSGSTRVREIIGLVLVLNHSKLMTGINEIRDFKGTIHEESVIET